MNKQVEKDVEKLYNDVLKKVYTKEELRNLSKGSRAGILKRVALLNSSRTYDKFARKFAKQLAAKGIRYKRGEWRKFFNEARKMNYIAINKTWTEFETEQLTKLVQQNFTMIKSLPNESVKLIEHKYTQTLINQVAKGSIGRRTFEQQLLSHGAKNAKMIARTETAKLQTSITKTRAQDLGSVAYRWVSTRDKRTRKSHQEMNGVVVFWRPEYQKPLLDGMRGDAGEFPNCRCAANPIVNVKRLEQSVYKVYDYRNDKIITMSKTKLIEHLQNGSLD